MKTTASSSPALLPGVRLKQILISISRQAERDIELFISCPRERHIHALRVRMKKLRALLPLIESSVGPTPMEAIHHGVRTLRLAFGASRDQQVAQALLMELHQPGLVSGPASVGAQQKTRTGKPPGPRRLRELKAAARSLTLRFQGLRMRTLTREDVAAAFAGNYAEARRRHKRCRRNPSAKRMHHWRTLVKDHFFQSLILLRDRRRCGRARKLGALLGKLHDFTLLRKRFSAGMTDDLHNAIRHRMTDLRALAFRKARRVLAPSPAKLEHRVLKALRP